MNNESLERKQVELNLDESNELFFTIMIQGMDSNAATVRLFCESNDVSYVFNGQTVDDGIRFVIPKMSNQLREGHSYPAKVEVIVENRHFTPMEFDIVFKPTAKVFVENMTVGSRKAPIVQPIVEMKRVVTEKPKTNEFANKLEPVKITATGIDPKTMEDVARSAVQRLLTKK